MKVIDDIPSFLPGHYRGKVRDVFSLNADTLVFITSDRLSAFDRAITAVPEKGAILNAIAAFWFARTEDIIRNHVVTIPDPNVMVVRKLDMLPVEVVVRRYMTGTTDTSIWTRYQAGEREIYGHRFPDGMKKNQELWADIVTPTTKGKSDIPISGAEIVARGLMKADLWAEVEATALKLFARGREIAATRGLFLVDTKYEFGVDADGRLSLADEIHTPDSSRYWIVESYEDRFSRGVEPESLDKEFVRRWLVERMADPYTDPIPDITPEDTLIFTEKYEAIYQKITGVSYSASATETDPLHRIGACIEKLSAIKTGVKA